MKSQTTLPLFFIASVLLAGIAAAKTSAARSAAPLPIGVEPSHNLVPGIYIRGETTVTTINRHGTRNRTVPGE